MLWYSYHNNRGYFNRLPFRTSCIVSFTDIYVTLYCTYPFKYETQFYCVHKQTRTKATVALQCFHCGGRLNIFCLVFKEINREELYIDEYMKNQ